MIDCPIEYFDGNLLFGNDGSCWACYEMAGFNYSMLNSELKLRILDKLTLFLSNIKTETKILLIPISSNIDERYTQHKKALNHNDALYKQALKNSDITLDYIKNRVVSGKENEYKTYIFLKLNFTNFNMEPLQAFKQKLEFLFKSVFDSINNLMGTATREIRETQLIEYQKNGEELRKEYSNNIVLLPVDSYTIQWLLRRNMFRGRAKDIQIFTESQSPWKPQTETITLAGNRYLRPRKREIVNLFQGSIHKEKRMLRVEQDNINTYQTFLSITRLPDTMVFPGNEWLYSIMNIPIGAEVCIHLETIDHDTAIKRLTNQGNSVKSEVENMVSAHNDIKHELKESYLEKVELERTLKKNRGILFDCAITICLSDTDPERLNDNAAFLLKRYRDLNFGIERPLTEQVELFMHMIPGTGFTVSDFKMRLHPQTVAAGIFGVNNELGDTSGYFIGFDSNGKPVFLNLGLACLNDMSANAFFGGALGGGKSFNANLLLYLSIIFGGYGLIIDPKGERTHWPEELTSLKGKISVVTISTDKKYSGTLDPFIIYKNDFSAAAQLAKTILFELNRELHPGSDHETVLNEALQKLAQVEKPSMSKLALILQDFDKSDVLYEKAYSIGRNILSAKNTGLTQLFVGTGDEESLSFENRLNILQVENLKLPPKGKEKESYSDEERISSIVMIIMSAFAKNFMHMYKGYFKTILVDEAWAMTGTQAGHELVEYAARMSRSLYTSLILNGHSVIDLNSEALKNTITYKFFFRTESKEEAVRILEFLKLEVNKHNIDMLLNLRSGQCLFQDKNKRTGFLQFDAVFQDIIDVFSTTPQDINNQKSTQEITLQDAAIQPTKNHVEDIDIFALEH